LFLISNLSQPYFIKKIELSIKTSLIQLNKIKFRKNIFFLGLGPFVNAAAHYRPEPVGQLSLYLSAPVSARPFNRRSVLHAVRPLTAALEPRAARPHPSPLYIG
jgi:hypothetical protein